MMTVTDKGRENRARRIAERRGCRLEKSRRRDACATDYGRYQLIDAATNTVASIGGPWLTLPEVERQLEVLSAVDEPNAVRLIQAAAKLVIALSPLAGLDPRTIARLAGPVTAAANLLGEATAEDLATEVRKILDAPPVAPPDVLTIRPLLDEVKAAFRAYESSRGRLSRPLMDAESGLRVSGSWRRAGGPREGIARRRAVGHGAARDWPQRGQPKVPLGSGTKSDSGYLAGESQSSTACAGSVAGLLLQYARIKAGVVPAGTEARAR